MSSRSKSAFKGKTVDIRHLEREIRQDVASYRQYVAEDEMKKRAVHSSKDYDEFRNFVSVSQLKPTSARDVSGLFSGLSGSFQKGSFRSSNIQRGSGTIGGLDKIVRKDATNPVVPMMKLDSRLKSPLLGKFPTANSDGKPGKSSTDTMVSSRDAYDFSREWKKHCKTAKDTLSFLTKTNDANGPLESKLVLKPDATCKKYFSTDIDSEIVGDIVEALHLLMCMNKGGVSPGIANTSASTSNNANEAMDFPKGPGLSELLSSGSTLSFTQGWLKALASCGRFELSIFFLVPLQQQKLKDICDMVNRSYVDKATGDDCLDLYHSLLK